MTRCYHGVDPFIGDQEDIDILVRAASGQMTPQDWKDYLLGKGYAAGVDVPIWMFYKDIMKAFPEVKVILTTRDPKSWYVSIRKIWEFHGLLDKTWAAHLVMFLLDGKRKNKNLEVVQ